MRDPLVTIVIPVYNHEDYVLETLDSVFSQTFKDFEVVVVNDGSPDRTKELLRPLVKAGRIRYIEQSNSGAAAARNRGIAEARGEFVAMLDDDDVWPFDRLNWQVEALQQHSDVVVVYGQAEFVLDGKSCGIHPAGPAPSGDVFDAFLREGWIQSPGQALIRRAALEMVGGLDADIWGTDDWDLWLRLSHQGKFQYDPRVSLRHRLHEKKASRDFLRMYHNGLRVVYKHLGRKPKPKDYERWVSAKRFVRRFCREDGIAEVVRLTKAKRCVPALAAWIRVLRVDPRMLIRWRYPARILKCLCV